MCCYIILWVIIYVESYLTEHLWSGCRRKEIMGEDTISEKIGKFRGDMEGYENQLL